MEECSIFSREAVIISRRKAASRYYRLLAGVEWGSDCLEGDLGCGLTHAEFLLLLKLFICGFDRN